MGISVKLNGWQRIGVVATLLWIVGGGIFTLIYLSNSADQYAKEISRLCYDLSKQVESCSDRYVEAYRNRMKYEGWPLTGLTAFVPPLLGWPLTYLILFTTRWIRRGFAPSQ